MENILQGLEEYSENIKIINTNSESFDPSLLTVHCRIKSNKTFVLAEKKVIR